MMLIISLSWFGSGVPRDPKSVNFEMGLLGAKKTVFKWELLPRNSDSRGGTLGTLISLMVIKGRAALDWIHSKIFSVNNVEQ